jgi:hypothetical protein
LSWSGQPDSWDGSGSAPSNSGLTGKVISYGTDIGCTGSLANLLLYYSAASGDVESRDIAKKLIDYAWDLYRDDIGFSSPEKRKDYKRFFDQELYVPSGFNGKMPNGDVIKPGIKFKDIRTNYKNDPDWARLEEAYENGEDPEFRYHRYWHQGDMAMAIGTMAVLFPNEKPPVDGPGLKGDLNLDAKVNAGDYTLMRRHILETQKLTDPQALSNADMNNDGKINAGDYTLLRREILNPSN